MNDGRARVACLEPIGCCRFAAPPLWARRARDVFTTERMTVRRFKKSTCAEFAKKFSPGLGNRFLGLSGG
jgi:hypothetical protein